MEPHPPDPVHPLFQEGGLEDYRRRLIRLTATIYQFSIGLVFIIALFLPPEEIRWPAFFVILGSGILSAFVLVAIHWERYRPDWFLIIALLAVVQISALIVVSGGDDSPFFSLYLFVIILSGAYFRGPALIAAILLVTLGSSAYHIFERPIHFDLDPLLSVPVYIAAALITNLLFRDLQRRSDEARLRAGRLEALYEATRVIHAESTSAALFEKLLEVARRATGARYAAIRTFDENGVMADFHHTGLTDEERELLKDPPKDTGVLGAINLSVSSVRLEDLTRDPRHAGFPSGHPVMKSFLGVSITTRNRLLGKLYLSEKSDRGPFTSDDEALVVALAQDAAIAIEKARLLEKIQDLATKDGLTDLFNRRFFEGRLKEEIERASRYHHACSLLMADVDDFKKLNDTHGHPAGDAALKAIAAAIRNLVRTTDFCARYGGEEFTVVAV
ncbi:MAG TPA: diguanylate cyclase, partial [Candidatus Manganitrophaceae bacterium]|nr:diguanylate cyclase [Candidatus Manganitrophaceae bacterium]